MPDKDEVLSTITTLADEIAAARLSLRNGVVPVVENAHQRFEECAQQVADLDPDDAILVRQPLQVLLDDLQTLSDTIAEIQSRLTALHGPSGQPTKDRPGGGG